jgi:hypothetical protein
MSILKGKTQLKSLTLYDIEILEKGMRLFTFKVLPILCNNNLSRLCLASFNIKSDAVDALCSTIKNCTGLETLKLQNNKITRYGAESIASMLRVNTSLTSLNLYGNKIGSSGAKKIIRALHDNTTLQRLNLSYNKLEDNTIHVFDEMLSRNTALTSLSIEENKFEISWDLFCDFAENNYTLIHLAIDTESFYLEGEELYEYNAIMRPIVRNRNLKTFRTITLFMMIWSYLYDDEYRYGFESDGCADSKDRYKSCNEINDDRILEWKPKEPSPMINPKLDPPDTYVNVNSDDDVIYCGEEISDFSIYPTTSKRQRKF